MSKIDKTYLLIKLQSLLFEHVWLVIAILRRGTAYARAGSQWRTTEQSRPNANLASDVVNTVVLCLFFDENFLDCQTRGFTWISHFLCFWVLIQVLFGTHYLHSRSQGQNVTFLVAGYQEENHSVFVWNKNTMLVCWSDICIHKTTYYMNIGMHVNCAVCYVLGSSPHTNTVA